MSTSETNSRNKLKRSPSQDEHSRKLVVFATSVLERIWKEKKPGSWETEGPDLWSQWGYDWMDKARGAMLVTAKESTVIHERLKEDKSWADFAIVQAINNRRKVIRNRNKVTKSSHIVPLVRAINLLTGELNLTA